MKTLVIIEDEKPAARRLERIINDLGYEVQKKLHSVEESVDWFQHQPKVDLIFLDIQLSDGLSFEIFEKVKVEADIIFTTAYDEYALKAFKLNSIDYLLKPIDVEELSYALQKFEKRHIAKLIDPEALKNLMQEQTSTSSFKTRFSVKIGEHIKTYPIEEIACFYSEYKATSLVTFEGKSYVIDDSLNTLEQQLPTTDFFRINRSHFINYKAIEDLVSYSTSRIKVNLKGVKEPAIVSRERVSDFKKWIG